MADGPTVWLDFLASPAAPNTAMSPLELDGYLTGIVVAPSAALILPSRWLPRLWGWEEPAFESDAQIKTVIGAVMERYDAIVAQLDHSLKRLETYRICDYRPMFLNGGDSPSHDAVRNWVWGFWKAMAVIPEVWRTLTEDERTMSLLRPFVSSIILEKLEPDERPENIEEILDEDAALIPQTILILRKLACIRAASADPCRRRTKIGRNHPCPCGSGLKYKRCCGRN